MGTTKNKKQKTKNNSSTWNEKDRPRVLER